MAVALAPAIMHSRQGGRGGGHQLRARCWAGAAGRMVGVVRAVAYARIGSVKMFLALCDAHAPVARQGGAVAAAAVAAAAVAAVAVAAAAVAAAASRLVFF